MPAFLPPFESSSTTSPLSAYSSCLGIVLNRCRRPAYQFGRRHWQLETTASSASSWSVFNQTRSPLLVLQQSNLTNQHLQKSTTSVDVAALTASACLQAETFSQSLTLLRGCQSGASRFFFWYPLPPQSNCNP